KRRTDKYLFTSKTLSLGSQITEGNHLYINHESNQWQEAVQILIQKMETLQELYGATTLMLRDLSATDLAMDDYMVDNGFFKIALPENYSIDDTCWNTKDEFVQQLSKRSKRHFKENIGRGFDLLKTTVHQTASDAEIEAY